MVHEHGNIEPHKSSRKCLGDVLRWSKDYRHCLSTTGNVYFIFVVLTFGIPQRGPGGDRWCIHIPYNGEEGFIL